MGRCYCKHRGCLYREREGSGQEGSASRAEQGSITAVVGRVQRGRRGRDSQSGQANTCPVGATNGSRWPSESSVVNSVGMEGGQGVRDGGVGPLGGWDPCLRGRGAVRRQLGDLGGDRGSLYVIKI